MKLGSRTLLCLTVVAAVLSSSGSLVSAGQRRNKPRVRGAWWGNGGKSNAATVGPVAPVSLNSAVQQSLPNPTSTSSNIPSGSLVDLQCDGLTDGKVSHCTLSLSTAWGGTNPPLSMQLQMPGVTCDKTSFSFEAATASTTAHTFKCKPDGCAATHTTTVTATLHYTTTATTATPLPSSGKIEIPYQRQPCGSGKALGDPHLETLDGEKFDFHTPGVYTIISSGAFQVQGFQDHCVLLSKVTSLGCYRGMAVAFGDAVVRLFMDEAKNNIVVAKGSDNYSTWLDVQKLEGHTEGYRVFTKVDMLSFVDVTTESYLGDKYLNLAFQVSPYFRTTELTGLLGNGNSVQEREETDVTALAEKFNVDMATNLLTCTTNCGSLVPAATAADSNAVTLIPSTTAGNAFFQGYTPYPATQTLTYTPQITTSRLRRTQESEVVLHDDDVAKRAEAICWAAIESVPYCNQYVDDVSFFIESYCVGDAVATGDLSVVESAKLAYLRECRRTIDTLVQASASEMSEYEAKALAAQRVELSFGDVSSCANACGGRGECLAAGCKCQTGYTGFSCEIQM